MSFPRRRESRYRDRFIASNQDINHATYDFIRICFVFYRVRDLWIPAFAGMTIEKYNYYTVCM